VLQVSQNLPYQYRAIAAAIAELAKTYAADRLLPLVGGFIMLRLLNPFLVTPDTYGLQNQGTRKNSFSYVYFSISLH